MDLIEIEEKSDFLQAQLNAHEVGEDHEIANGEIDGPRLGLFQDVYAFLWEIKITRLTKKWENVMS